MVKRYLGGMTVAASAVAVAFAAPPVASAQSGPPQPDQPCADTLAGALVRLPDGRSLLQCRNQPAAGLRWQPFLGDYPTSDRWLTYGPELKLTGQGQRNPEIMSGDWVAVPQDSDAECGATQTSVVSAGKLSPAEQSTGKPGEPLQFELPATLFTVTLTGNCQWQKTR